MRRRSNTIYADSIEEYMQAAKLESSYPFSFSAHTSRHPAKQILLGSKAQNKALSSEDNTFSLLTPETSDSEGSNADEKGKDSSAYWNSFDFDCEDPFLHSLPKEDADDSTIPSIVLTADTDCSEDAEEHHERTRQCMLKKLMIIGVNDSGKHSLIDTAFECGQSKLQGNKRAMDLLTKTEKDEDNLSETRYQFWIRNLSNENIANETLENLIKIYYRNVSLFVFVYSVSDKKSFECLTNTIQSIKDEVGEDKFTGVLLGNKCDLESKREVSVFEGLSLQEKHKLMFFMETNHEDKTLKARLLELLHEVEGGVDELQSRKRVSVLSMD